MSTFQSPSDRMKPISVPARFHTTIHSTPRIPTDPKAQGTHLRSPVPFRRLRSLRASTNSSACFLRAFALASLRTLDSGTNPLLPRRLCHRVVEATLQNPFAFIRTP